MAKRIPVSFKNTPEETMLYKFLQDKSSIMGYSAYIKTLLKKEMGKEKNMKNSPSLKRL